MRADAPKAVFDRKARAALAQPNGEDAYVALAELIWQPDTTRSIAVGEVLRLMRLIDDAFYAIHPRAVVVGPSNAQRPTVPLWLRSLRDHRIIHGRYASDQLGMLVPRGPLLRAARDPDASSAYSLADQFAALAIVPLSVSHEGRMIALRSCVVSCHASYGVLPSKAPGSEQVAFMPVAERARDIKLTTRKRGQRRFVDYCASSSLDSAQTIRATLERLNDIDIALAPEFLVSEADAGRLSAMLAGSERSSVRMILAGTGHTKAVDSGVPWNEARVLNACGLQLWTQRKIWPATIDRERALKLKLPDPGEGCQLMEDTAAGEEFMIADVDGIGRSIVLICQDVKASPLARDLIVAWQPDWVLIPIMDTGVDEERWTHVEAYRLAGFSQARFLIVSSTALCKRAGFSSFNCGLAIGPSKPSGRDGSPVDVPNAFQVVSAVGSPHSGAAVIKWRDGAWLSTGVRSK